MKWDFFEKLMSVLHFKHSSETKKEMEDQHPEVAPLFDKKEALELQRQRFEDACEHTIMDEYKNLRRAHREFMNSYEYTQQQLASKNDSA